MKIIWIDEQQKENRKSELYNFTVWNSLGNAYQVCGSWSWTSSWVECSKSSYIFRVYQIKVINKKKKKSMGQGVKR